MTDEMSREDLLTKVYKLEEALAKHTETAPRSGKPDDIQVIQVLDAARERLIKWVQLLLIPFAFVLAFGAFLGIKEVTDIREVIRAMKVDLNDSTHTIKKDLEGSLGAIKKDLNASGASLDFDMRQFRNSLDAANAIIKDFNVYHATPRERQLLGMNANLFLRHIQDIIMERRALEKIREIKEITVSKDPHLTPVSRYNGEVVLAFEYVANPEFALFELAAFFLKQISPQGQWQQPEAGPVKEAGITLLVAVQCYLVESFLRKAPEIITCQPLENPQALDGAAASTSSSAGAADQVQKQEDVRRLAQQGAEASAALSEAFRELAQRPGMDMHLTASLLIDALIGANSRNDQASLQARFSRELQRQALSIRERQQPDWKDLNPEALADLIRRLPALKEGE